MQSLDLEFNTVLRVVGNADPQLPARLLALVTQRNEFPLDFHVRLGDEDLITVEVRVTGCRDRLAVMARRIPTVVSASATLVGHPRAAPPLTVQRPAGRG